MKDLHQCHHIFAIYLSHRERRVEKGKIQSKTKEKPERKDKLTNGGVTWNANSQITNEGRILNNIMNVKLKPKLAR
jgi:hypothetical protein